MRFLANENIPLRSIALIGERGFDIKSVAREMPGAKDSEVLQYAHNESHIVLTFDRDYGELIYKHQITHLAGVIYFRFDPTTPEEPAELILQAIAKNIPLSGRFTVVERDAIRQRVLPHISSL